MYVAGKPYLRHLNNLLLKNRPAIILLLTANMVSGFAQGISMLAIPWYFISIMNTPTTFGIIYGASTFASLFWSLYSGTLIDRYSRKNLFLLTSAVGGTVLLAVSCYGYYTGYVPISLIAVVFTLTVFVFNMHYPNLYAFGQEITEKKNYGKINSYLEIQGQSTSILAGAIAAVLLQGTSGGHINMLGIMIDLPFEITPWALHDIFMLDAVTYLISIILISLIRYTPIATKQIELGTIINRIKSGIAFLQNNRLLLIFGITSYTVFVTLLIEVHMLLPLYVNNHLLETADVYASAEVYYAIGALMAGIGIRWLFRKTNSVKAVLVLMVFTIGVFYTCAFTRITWLFFFVSLIFGVTNAGIRVLRITYLFNHIPNSLIGRVSSVFNVTNILMRLVFIGLFSIPFFNESNNVVYAYFIFGTFILVSVFMLMTRYKQLIELKEIPD